MEFLPNRGPDAFIRFVEALKADYSWLADNLEEEFEAAETSKIDDLSDGDLDKQVFVRKSTTLVWTTINYINYNYFIDLSHIVTLRYSISE